MYIHHIHSYIAHTVYEYAIGDNPKSISSRWDALHRDTVDQGCIDLYLLPVRLISSLFEIFNMYAIVIYNMDVPYPLSPIHVF